VNLALTQIQLKPAEWLLRIAPIAKQRVTVMNGEWYLMLLLSRLMVKAIKLIQLRKTVMTVMFA